MYGLLKPYSSLVTKLALKFEKDIEELIIEGDKNFVVDNKLKPFIKSLGYVFRNSIDHKIENPEERVMKEKEGKGVLIYQFKEKNNKLHITISDDGMGLNSIKIMDLVINKGINISFLSENELYKIISNDNFSIKTIVSEISGRGVSISAVKNELDKLDWVAEIISQKDIDTTFEFIIPL